MISVRCLVRVLVNSFVPSGPVVFSLDDTIERRWGAKIKARGIYRDPVRSSHSHFVKASSLQRARYMSLETIAPLSDNPTVSLPAIAA
jgi:hypothetical protein